MKKSEIVVIAGVLEKLAKFDDASVKFKYAIARNIKIVAPIVSPIYEMRDAIEKDFETQRIDICKKHCTKDENGEPVIEGDNFVGLQGNEEFSKEFAELGESMKSKFDDIQSVIEDEEEISFYKISVADIPQSIKTDMLIVIEPLITE